MVTTTLYLEKPIHKSLRLRAVESRRSMLGWVNDALKVALLEDLEDIETWKERKNDEVLGFEDFVQSLKRYLPKVNSSLRLR